MDKPAPTPSFAERFARPKETSAASGRRSQADQMIAKSGHLVHKLKAKDTTGRWAYYFVYVEASKERVFLDAIKSDGIIDLEDYGKVIASCYGETPSEEIRQLLKDKYGFDV